MTSALACTGVVVLNSLQGYRDIDTMVGRVKPSVFFFRSVVPRLPKLFSLTQAVAKNLEQPKASAMGRAVMRFVSSQFPTLRVLACRIVDRRPKTHQRLMCFRSINEFILTVTVTYSNSLLLTATASAVFSVVNHFENNIFCHQCSIIIRAASVETELYYSETSGVVKQ